MRDSSWTPWAVVALGYAVGAVLVLPVAVVVLMLGLAALGFETGWWPGDSNMNDGEGVPGTMLGLLVLGGFGLGTAWGTMHHLREVGARRAARWVPIVVSASLVAAAIVVSFVLLGASYPLVS